MSYIVKRPRDCSPNFSAEVLGAGLLACCHTSSVTATDYSHHSPSGSLPYIKLDGKLFAQTYPTLRWMARKLGKYDGKTDEEKYVADVICDQALDWRTRFVDSAFSTTAKGLNPAEETKAFDHHKEYLMPKYVRGIEKHLANSPYSQGGPYTLGAEITCESIVGRLGFASELIMMLSQTPTSSSTRSTTMRGSSVDLSRLSSRRSARR